MVKGLIYVQHIATARPLCGVKAQLTDVSDKQMECGVTLQKKTK